MDHPVKDSPHVIHLLTQGTPDEQTQAVETYFTPDASFRHPICCVPGFSDRQVPLFGVINSRWVILMIYRWYKILSPRIVLTVHSSVYDQKSDLLYVSISQIFSIWFIPFYHANIDLVTVLKLRRNPKNGKYYIKDQHHLYQIDDVARLVLPWVGAPVVIAWQYVGALLSVLGAVALWPVLWVKQRRAEVLREKGL